ncbi:MAG: hypothetical protein ABI634_16120 [Acidobacteriota bacterium]
MADRPSTPQDPGASRRPAGSSPIPKPIDARPQPAACADEMLCDRCRASMFRMHAVWRCPACGYKTDCCGW